jgi:hypothetical protein
MADDLSKLSADEFVKEVRGMWNPLGNEHAWCDELEAELLRRLAPPAPKMGPGDFSCAVCGMGMVEPCEHWKANMPNEQEEVPAPGPQTVAGVPIIIDKNVSTWAIAPASGKVEEIAREIIKALEPEPIKCSACGQEIVFSNLGTGYNPPCPNNISGHIFSVTIGGEDQRPAKIALILRKHGVGQPCPLCTVRIVFNPGDTPSCHVCGAVMKRVTSQIGAALGWHECASCGASNGRH